MEKKKKNFRGSYKEKNEEGGPRVKILGDFKFWRGGGFIFFGPWTIDLGGIKR